MISSIIGRAMGYALAGFIPIVEIQFRDYLNPAWQQLVDQAGTMSWRSGGRFSCPMVIRMSYGGYLGGAGALWHSETANGPILHQPGLRVCVPSNARDAVAAMRAAVFSGEVVLFMDCCRNDYTRAPLMDPVYEKRTSMQPARVCYGFATKWSRAARERPLAQTGVVRGLFTLVLLEGLRGAAPRDSQGNVTGATLKAYVLNELPKRFGTGEFQEPQILADDPVVFPAPAAKVPDFHVRVTLSPANTGKPVELLDGALKPIPGNKPSPDRWEWHVSSPGLYQVRVAGGPEQVPFPLIGEGEVKDVTI
jgi:hypothetical protein